jgi:PTH1 family peptidyl-tRNA hydrolase
MMLKNFRKGSTPAPFLIVGLGNPDPEFKLNRHNVGFMVLDELATQLGENFGRVKFESLITQAHYKEERLVLAKPRTYMNRSGRAVGALLRFHKLSPDRLMVIYDDVDLPFDSLRIRPEGGSAGHKGMRSIIETLGTQSFPRLRVGIGKAAGKMKTPSHVLQDFSAKEQEILPIVLKDAAEAAFSFVSEGIAEAMNRHNRSDA